MLLFSDSLCHPSSISISIHRAANALFIRGNPIQSHFVAPPPPFFFAVTVVRRERILSLLLSVTVTSPKTREDFENTAFFMMRRRINVMSGCVGSNTNIIYNWGFYIATFLFFLSNSLLRGGGNGMMTRYYIFFPSFYHGIVFQMARGARARYVSHNTLRVHSCSFSKTSIDLPLCPPPSNPS